MPTAPGANPRPDQLPPTDEAVALALDRVTRRFGSVVAVNNLSLAVRPGEFVTLLGPSGCGKTTALRIIAGFETADEGVVRFRGEDVTRKTPQQRGFGMVFQNYALFPHLSVGENVAFGLKARKRPGDEIKRRVAAALERVELPGYGDRAVQALSGGQQQRVALARALAIEPPILLLDEPLSNLDAALREKTRTEIRRLVKQLGITALFVTHDQEEAFDLADRIAVMNAGHLRQLGTPAELYLEPADRFVAGFVGRANFLPVERVSGGDSPPGEGAGGEHGGVPVRVPGVGVWEGAVLRKGASGPGATPESTSPSAYTLMVRPEDFTFSTNDVDNTLRGVVLDRRFRGALTAFLVDVENVGTLEVLGGMAGPRVDERVGIIPRPGARLHLFPDPG